MAQVIAVLETMYDWRGMTTGAGHTVDAPPYFNINPRNHSGKRLYRLIGDDHELLVTNACRELGRTANCHGKPSPGWLRGNLEIIARKHPFSLLLVCGKVAQATFKECGFECAEGVSHMLIPHPAARMWTSAMINNVAAEIASRLRSVEEMHV